MPDHPATPACRFTPSDPSPPRLAVAVSTRGRWFDLAAVGVLSGSLAGLAGGWHWLLDLTTHFRCYWFALAVAGLVACGRWRRPTAAACFALAAVANARDLLPYWLPAAAPPAAPAAADHRLRVTAVNVRRINDDTAAAVAYLRDRGPDVAAVLEVDDAWAAALEGLAGVFPHRVIRPRPDNFGIALLSRWPLADVDVVAFCETGYPSIVADVQHPAGEFRLIATHPYPPFDGRCTALLAAHLDGVAEAVRRSTLPCIVAGDLNATPWSRPFRRLVAASGLVDSAIGRGVRPTWHAGLPAPRIPIDHVLVPVGTIVVDRRVGPPIGSDHVPIEADLVLPATR